MLSFKGQRGGRIPLAQQLSQHIRSEIEADQLQQGDLLPAAGAYEHFSRMTVLEAYRQLAHEGWVTMSPSRGTIVAQGGTFGHVGILSFQDRGQVSGIYRSQMSLALMQWADPKGKDAVLYHLQGPKPTSLQECEAAMPQHLKRDLLEGKVRALVVPFDHLQPVVEDWLKSLRLPVIAFAQKPSTLFHTLAFDYPKLMTDMAEFDAQRGVSETHVVISPNCEPFNSGELPSQIKTQRIDYGQTPIESGKIFAQQWLRDQHQKHHALALLDDIFALGVLQEFYKNGLNLERDIKLHIAGVESQITPLFHECSQWLCHGEELAKQCQNILEQSGQYRNKASHTSIPFHSQLI